MAPIREMLAETGITEQQWRVLRVLHESGPQDTSTLAQRASLLFPSLTRIARTMQTKGLISQTRDENDRRRQLIEITPAGREIIDNNAKTAAEIADSFKKRLGKQNYENLLDLLEQLYP